MKNKIRERMKIIKIGIEREKKVVQEERLNLIVEKLRNEGNRENMFWEFKKRIEKRKEEKEKRGRGGRKRKERKRKEGWKMRWEREKGVQYV